MGIPKERRFVGLSGWRGAVRLGVHNHNLNNVVRGLVERVYRVEDDNGSLAPPPKPALGAYSRLADFRERLLRKLHCRPWSYDEFILSYKGAKKVRMQEAVDTLSRRGVQRTDAELRTFVKAEKINFTSKPDPAPRVIQPRDAVYNAAVGIYLKAVEHPAYAAIAEIWGGPTVMKGYNARQVAKHIIDAWREFDDPVAIGLDASRFDQHVSVPALEWEHSVYNAVFRSPELRRLLKWQLKNIGKAYTPDGVVKYVVEGCRMSGDMNTALGNCLIMCALVWTMCQESRLPKARLINNGDDCVLILERQHMRKLPNIKTWFKQFGFNMKQEPTVDTPEQIEFCQMHPIFDGEEWIMSRSPAVGLMKDLTNIRPQFTAAGDVDVGAFARWCYGVGEAGLSMAGGLPIFQEHYSAMMRFGERGRGRKLTGFGDESTGFEFLAKDMKRVYGPVSDAARVSFWRAYGVLPDLQIAIEDHIRSIKSWRMTNPESDHTNVHYG